MSLGKAVLLNNAKAVHNDVHVFTGFYFLVYVKKK